MAAVFQRYLPPDMQKGSALPGTRPVSGQWLHLDEAYAGQMARRTELLREAPEQVLYQDPTALDAARELLSEVLDVLPELGFELSGNTVVCPDGRRVDISSNEQPMMLLGHLLQNDFVVLDKRGEEHQLSAAVLCFPASWRLYDKVGRPLREIHVPVAEYTEDVARRVQRLFDGIQVGRPLWRFNQLWYEDPELFQPRSVEEPRRVDKGEQTAPYYRTERQTLLRLPKSKAVVFAIHTLVLRREDVLKQRQSQAGIAPA